MRNTHDPADPENCDDCAMAGITKQPSKQKEPNKYRNAEFDGLVVSVDFITGLPRDNDGNTCGFHVDEVTQDLGYIIPCRTQNLGDILNNFKTAIQKLCELVPKKKRHIKTMHSINLENSFIGDELAQYIKDNHWSRTTTKGYDHNAAARIENRNRRIKKHWRKFLLHEQVEECTISNAGETLPNIQMK